MTGDAIVATLALGAVCVLMWWLARLAKRRMGIGAGTVSSAGLRVVGKRPLDQKSSLYVVEIAGGRHILLGSSLDGSVTKLDDISFEEFEAMTADEPAKTPKLARPRLRVATPQGEGEAPTGETDANEDASDDAPGFASVGESFHHFLGKAKDARAARRERRASGE